MLAPTILALVSLVAPLAGAPQEPAADLPTATQIRRAVFERDLPRIRALVEAEPGLLESPDDGERRYTPVLDQPPLRIAVRFDLLDVAALLLELGADPMRANDDGFRPLESVRSAEMVRLLVDAGADARAIERTSGSLLVGMHWDANAIQQRTARALVDAGARINLPAAIRFGWTDDVRRQLRQPAAAPLHPNLLYQAARRGHVEIVELLLDAGANPNAHRERDINVINDTSAESPLAAAIWSGSHDVATRLVEAGARSDGAGELFGNEGWQLIRGQGWSVGPNAPTPGRDGDFLDRAVDDGHGPLVTALIRAGLDATGRSDCDEFDSRDHRLVRAAWRGHTEVVDALLESGVPIDEPSRGATALFAAAAAGHGDLHDHLLERGATASLHAAAALGRVELVRALAAAWPERIDEPDERCGRTPLAWASHFGHVDAVELLIEEGASPRSSVGVVNASERPWAATRRSLMPSKSDEYAIAGHVLGVAVDAEQMDVAVELIEAGARIDGPTLERLCRIPDPAATAVLRAGLASGFDGSVAEGDSVRALCALTGAELPEGVALERLRILEDSGLADRLRASDGSSVLSRIGWRANVDVAARVRDLGAPVDHSIAARFGWANRIRELDAAGSQPSKARVKLISSAMHRDDADVVEALLEGAAESDEIDEGALVVEAALKGRVKVQRLLEGRGSIVPPETRYPDNALHRAVSDPDQVRRLLREGVDPNGVDEFGKTPLHRAARNGRVESIRLLIDAGADVNARGRRGDTPLSVLADHSANARKLEAARLLLEAGADPLAIERASPRAYISLLWECNTRELWDTAAEMLREHLPPELHADLDG